MTEDDDDMDGIDSPFVAIIQVPCINCLRPVQTPVPRDEYELIRAGMIRPFHICGGCLN